MNFSVPFVPVLVAALVSFFIGFMWHGPVLGKQWMKLMNMSKADLEKGKKEMQKKMPYYMLVALVQQLVTAYTLSLLAYVTNASDAMGAVILAFIVWLGFIATVLLNGVLWEKRSIPLYLFNIAYHFVIVVAMALIVTLWR